MAATPPERLRQTMHGAPLWARTATVAAGPVFNFILSILIFSAVMMAGGKTADPLTVGALKPLPVEGVTLQPGDEVLPSRMCPCPTWAPVESMMPSCGICRPSRCSTTRCGAMAGARPRRARIRCRPWWAGCHRNRRPSTRASGRAM